MTPRLRPLLAVLLFVACSSLRPTPKLDGSVPLDGGDGSDGGSLDGGSGRDGGLPLSGACDTLTARRCDYLQRCGLVAPGAQARRDCLAAFTATWCGPALWPALAAPGVGTVKYDSVKAQVCADAFLTLDCSAFAAVPDVCNRFLSPNTQLRAACYDGVDQCTDGACRGVVCPRTCQPLGVALDVCRFDDDCASGLYCRPSATTPGTGQCAAPGSGADSCDVNTRCATGFTCLQGSCQLLPVSGTSCLSGRCDESSYCVEALDGGVCVARKSAGATCSDSTQCGATLVCASAGGLCVPKVVKSAGTACDVLQQCGTGLTCVGATTSHTGLCQSPADAGAGCAVSTDCRNELACRRTDGGSQCGPRGSTGDECATSRDCRPEAVCHEGICVDLPPLGSSCAVTKQCWWGACLDTLDGGAVCADPQGPGATCTSDGACASGRCVLGLCLASCTP
jgi:hypothetical protein